MRLVGFVIRIYHDARSSECQSVTWCMRGEALNVGLVKTRSCNATFNAVLFVQVFHYINR